MDAIEYRAIIDDDRTTQRLNRLRAVELAHADATDELKLAKAIGDEQHIATCQAKLAALMVQHHIICDWLQPAEPAELDQSEEVPDAAG